MRVITLDVSGRLKSVKRALLCRAGDSSSGDMPRMCMTAKRWRVLKPVGERAGGRTSLFRGRKKTVLWHDALLAEMGRKWDADGSCRLMGTVSLVRAAECLRIIHALLPVRGHTQHRMGLGELV